MARKRIGKGEQALLDLKDISEQVLAGRVGLLAPFLDHDFSQVVAAACNLAIEAEAAELAPRLLAVLERVLEAGAERDPGCSIKDAAVAALIQFDCRDPDPFRRGIGLRQMEGFPPADSAAGFRARCLQALVNMNDPEALFLAADMLARDPEPQTRAGAAEALGCCPGEPAALVLRMKVLAGDAIPDVLGNCFSALMKVDAARSRQFLARYLKPDGGDLTLLAALALGESGDRGAFAVLEQAWHRWDDHGLHRALYLPLVLTRDPAAVDLLLTEVAAGPNLLAREALRALATFAHDPALKQQVERVVDSRGDKRLRSWFRDLFS